MESERELECATDERGAETSARSGQVAASRLVSGEGTTKCDRRLLNTFASEAEQAIAQHSARYGLDVCLLYVLDNKKRFHGIAYSTEGYPTVHLNPTKPNVARRGTLNELEPEDKYFVAQAFRLLDEHCVANRFWEDLSALFAVPSLGLIKKHRDSVDIRYDIKRTPGTPPGTHISFTDDGRNALHEM
ncbi:hypothetical protein MTO96_014120 [Rhipicephalus appendiculatus]